MRIKIIFIVLSFVLLFILTISVIGQKATDADERLAQETAQRFVKRIQETRDVSPLIKELFNQNFIRHLGCVDEDFSPSFYPRLSQNERLRLFNMQINTSYLVSIDVIQRADYILKNSETSAFMSILPPNMAKKLRKALVGSTDLSQFTSYRDFKRRMPKIEKILFEATKYLQKRGIEQTQEFQKKLDDTISGNGLNYKVSVHGEGSGWEFVGIKKQKFYQVETPLFFALMFVKDGEQMKVVCIGEADGD
jgi:hypothetical protein